MWSVTYAINGVPAHSIEIECETMRKIDKHALLTHKIEIGKSEN